MTEFPRLQVYESRSRCSMVNKSYVPYDHMLNDGDEIALIPPVSGGDCGLDFVFNLKRLILARQSRLVAHSGAEGVFVYVCRNGPRSWPR